VGIWKRWSYIRRFKLNVLRFIRMRESPDEIAKGFALGVFVGLTPTMGIQIPIAIVLAMLLKENKLAAALGVWVTNPLTAPFIYALEYEIGRVLLGMERARLPEELSLGIISELGWGVLLPLTVGSLILGAICTALAYALALRFLPVLRTWHIPRWSRPRGKR
jgi:uncharacterized protein